jgi:competence protein ComEC
MKETRFRAYQLGTRGSSFSYTVGRHITLIEARYNEVNKENVKSEMKRIGESRIDCLHITSWDEDHCNYNELMQLLIDLSPRRVDYPWYQPDTSNGLKSKALIEHYLNEAKCNGSAISPEYINGLEEAELLKYNDILYNPVSASDKHNDNSVVQLFRQGRFTVLSLGDCESPDIAERIMYSTIASKEVDVLILAHHGADNGFTTKEFIERINPRVAICSSNYDNQFEHPKPEIRKILYDAYVPLYTTKTGDIIIDCPSGDVARVYNFISNNEVLNSSRSFKTKMTVPD